MELEQEKAGLVHSLAKGEQESVEIKGAVESANARIEELQKQLMGAHNKMVGQVL